MLVFLINAPILVMRGSSRSVSLPAAISCMSIRMDRNFQILKRRFPKAMRGWKNNGDPLLSNLIRIAIISNKGERTIKANADTKMSKVRFTNF